LLKAGSRRRRLFRGEVLNPAPGSRLCVKGLQSTNHPRGEEEARLVAIQKFCATPGLADAEYRSLSIRQQSRKAGVDGGSERTTCQKRNRRTIKVSVRRNSQSARSQHAELRAAGHRNLRLGQTGGGGPFKKEDVLHEGREIRGKRAKKTEKTESLQQAAAGAAGSGYRHAPRNGHGSPRTRYRRPSGAVQAVVTRGGQANSQQPLTNSGDR